MSYFYLWKNPHHGWVKNLPTRFTLQQAWQHVLDKRGLLNRLSKPLYEPKDFAVGEETDAHPGFRVLTDEQVLAALNPPPARTELLPRGKVTLLSDSELDHLEMEVVAERNTRRNKAALIEALPGLSNFLLGAAHAMACREALRWAAGDPPRGANNGTAAMTPMHGRMWNAWDGVDLVYRIEHELPPRKRNADNEYLRWRANPLLWKDESQIRSGLSNWDQRLYRISRYEMKTDKRELMW